MWSFSEASHIVGRELHTILRARHIEKNGRDLEGLHEKGLLIADEYELLLDRRKSAERDAILAKEAHFMKQENERHDSTVPTISRELKRGDPAWCFTPAALLSNQ